MIRTCCTACGLFIHSGAGCIFKRDNGRCRCATKITLVPGEEFVATVSRGGDIVASEIISVTESSKLTWLEILKSAATRIRLILIHGYWTPHKNGETLFPLRQLNPEFQKSSQSTNPMGILESCGSQIWSPKKLLMMYWLPLSPIIKKETQKR